MTMIGRGLGCVRRGAGAVLLGAMLAGLSAQAQEVQFGPGLRSLDSAEVFDRSAPARARMWDAFHDSGIRTIVLSQALISPFTPTRARRPDGAFFSDRDLAHVRDTLNRGPSTADDFHVTYVAGYGLSTPACALGPDPERVARAAADWEFDTIISRVLDSGIPIRAMEVDGPFLRVIEKSKKGFSCAVAPESAGYAAESSARIVMSYMKRLRDLTDGHETNRAAGVEVEMALLFNLPNWTVGAYPALDWAGETGDLVNEVLPALGRAMRADTDDRPLSLSGATIDYPFFFARNDQAAFKAKSEGVLAALRALPRTRARLTFFTNTDYRLDPRQKDDRYQRYPGTVRCVWADNWRISGGSLPYLPYEDAKGTKMPADCVAQQNKADERYWDESAAFANHLVSGNWRARTVALEDIAAFRFMSWHEMPASSLSTMNRVLRYRRYGN